MGNWWRRGNADHILDKPWLSPASIEMFEGLLEPYKSVFEHGAGGSTLWLAERVKEVTSVESDSKWMDALCKIVPGNVTLILSSAHLQPKQYEYDIVFLDGEPLGERAAWLRKVQQMVKSGGWVILDNANRPEYFTERAELKRIAEEVITIDANEAGTLYLVTEFYRMPDAIR